MAEKEVEAAECIKRLLDYLNALERLQAPTERQSAVLLGYGWWVRVLRTAAATDRLHQGGFGHEASPLVRTVVHHAAALVRLAKDPDEVIEAVEYQHRQKAQKFAAGAITGQWDLSGVTGLPEKPKGPAPAGLVYLEKFEKLCHDMGLSDVYVSYMIESAYLHPTANGADVYLELTSEEELRLRNESSLDATPL